MKLNDLFEEKTTTKPCSVCGKPHTPGGYAHPTKCWHCAPVAVSQAKIRRNLRDKKSKTKLKEMAGTRSAGGSIPRDQWFGKQPTAEREKLLYGWVKQGTSDLKEFRHLLQIHVERLGTDQSEEQF